MGNKKIIAKNNNTTITLSGGLDILYTNVLKLVEPEIAEVLEKEVEALEREAKKNWPVRQPLSKSKRSVDKFDTGLVLSQKSIGSYITNYAQYASVIRSGSLDPSVNRTNQVISTPSGDLVWVELLWKPAKKSAQAVTRFLGNKFVKEMKRV